MVKFDNKYYSVPYKLIRKSVDKVVVLNEIHIYYNKIFVTSHKINDNLVNKHPEHVHASVSLQTKTHTAEEVDSFESEYDRNSMSEQVSKNFERLRGAY